MLKQFSAKGFKSLHDVALEFKPLTVLFGPHDVGKTNILDAVRALARLATMPSVAEALAVSFCMNPKDIFSFADDVDVEQLKYTVSCADLAARFEVRDDNYIYRLGVLFSRVLGKVGIHDEYLAHVAHGRETAVFGRKSESGELRGAGVVRKGIPYPILGERAIMSEQSGERGYQMHGRQAHKELCNWRFYSPDARAAMRVLRAPEDVSDIGFLGESFYPFVNKLSLKRPRQFENFVELARSLVPSFAAVSVSFDEKAGEVVLQVRKEDAHAPSPVVSDRMLRVLAISAAIVNPWGGGVRIFDVPEAGIHYARYDILAERLVSLVREDGCQVVLATASPLFCEALIRAGKDSPDTILLQNVRKAKSGTQVRPASAKQLFLDRQYWNE